MNIIFALLLILFAGIINGSFPLPTKYMPKWGFEHIWLQYALWGFVILPWTFVFMLEPQILKIYTAAPAALLWLILGGGIIFGSGQVCFALALHMIGFGLGFFINLGLGISLGFLLPLVIQHPQQIFTPFGLTTLAGIILSIIGLLVSTHAGVLRDREKTRQEKANLQQTSEQLNTGKNSKYAIGVLLAAIAGLSSAGQNLVFSLTYGLQQLATNMGAHPFVAANILWPIFLTCGFIPYALYTLYLHYKNSSFSCYKVSGTGIYYVFVVIMGLCSYGSLLCYGKASQLIGSLGPLVGWPMFMILVILTSSFWGWKYREWEGCSAKPIKIMKQGLVILILAIMVLGYSSSLQT